MSTIERIEQEIKTLERSELEELLEIIRHFLDKEPKSNDEGTLSRRSKIQIDGPEDLSVNHDLYFRGEKVATSNTD